MRGATGNGAPLLYEDNMRWQRIGTRRDVDVTTVTGINKAFFQVLDENGIAPESWFTWHKDRTFFHHANFDFDKFGEVLFEKDFDAKEKIIGYYEDGLKWLEEVRTVSGHWAERLDSTSSSQDLSAAFEQCAADFHYLQRIYNITAWVVIESWQTKYGQMVDELLRAASVDDVMKDRLLESVYQPWRKTAIRELEDDLRAGRPISEIMDQYQFMRSWTLVWYKPITEDWLAQLNQDRPQVQVLLPLSEVIETLQPTDEQIRNLELAPYIIFFKDWRDDLRREQVYRWSFLIDLIADHLAYSRDDLGYLSIDEIKDSLNGKIVDASVIETRKVDGCVICFSESLGVEVAPIDSFRSKIDEASHLALDIREFRGLVASPGKAQGRARLVKGVADLKRVEPGDILVASTTHPDYLPALSQAAAFVTDEGGMISHAAIVAREMKKPCVVGAKVAMQVLHDGDMIEVDANIGLVTILKRGI